MDKTIVIIGALDTKGEEYAFLKSEIEKRGCRTLVVNVGVLGESQFEPEVSAAEVAEAAGTTLADLVARRDRGAALDAMSRGVAVIARQLFASGRVDGIISMGGGGGTGAGTSAMRALPVTVPKLMVSTIASGDTSPYVGTSNITMMPSIVDVAGLNRISRQVFTQAAGAVCGMTLAQMEQPAEERPLIAASMFGNTTRCVDLARRKLENERYEVLVFHATGTGGKSMEMLIRDGYFAGVLDVTTTEWADEVCGGVLTAGPTRLEAAAASGVPQVVVPGCLDMCNFWAPETVPAQYQARRLHHWNPNVTLMRTTPEENARLGEVFAEKLNAARGPVKVFVPLRGFSELDAPGQPFWWPEADQAFVEALTRRLRPGIPVITLDYNINDPEFSGILAETLLKMIEEGTQDGDSA